MNITANFTLEEMTFSARAARLGIDNTPSPEHFRNMRRLCALLEDVRDVVGAPGTVTSGYRCPLLNAQTPGSSDKSQHMYGTAADTKWRGLSPDETIQIILEADLDFDQMIREYDSWVHISVPNNPQDKPRKQVLIIDSKGTRPYA